MEQYTEKPEILMLTQQSLQSENGVVDQFSLRGD